jgi:hypothetical protein
VDDGVEDDTQTVPEKVSYRLSPLLATVVVEPAIGLPKPALHGGGVEPAVDPLPVPWVIGVPLTLEVVVVRFGVVETTTPFADSRNGLTLPTAADADATPLRRRNPSTLMTMRMQTFLMIHLPAQARTRRSRIGSCALLAIVRL